jgi:hypothetical protein
VDMMAICLNKFDSEENLDKNKLPPRKTTKAIAILSSMFVTTFVMVRYKIDVKTVRKNLLNMRILHDTSMLLRL